MTNTIAMTILEQLGGNRFLAMTGAKHLVSDSVERSLTMKLGRFPGVKIVCVVIKLDPSDTYTVKAYDSKALKACGLPTKIATGVHADALRRTFTHLTGLDCTL